MGRIRFLSRRQLLVAIGAGAIFTLDSRSAPDVATGKAPRPLFLHWWRPTYFVKDENFNDKSEPSTRILSMRVVPGEDLSITLGNGSPALHGRIEFRGKRCRARLQGKFAGSLNFVDADVELDKPFEGGYLNASGITWETRFVLFADAECERFLTKELLQEPGT